MGGANYGKLFTQVGSTAKLQRQLNLSSQWQSLENSEFCLNK